MGDTASLSPLSADPAIIFLDSTFKPVSYNEEAVRVLGQSIENGVKRVLSSLRSSNQRTSIHCGDRSYNVRLVTLTADSPQPTTPAHALLLERSDRNPIDVTIAVDLFRLTPRERETLEFLVQGMTSKEIASQMGVSPHTVKAFLRLMMSKMQVSTRSGIIGKLLSPGLRSTISGTLVLMFFT